MSIDKIRVMIVDDVSETRENVRKLLQFDSDVDVIGFAGTGREAVQLSMELNPDVILMDINMPDMDGISATEAIRWKQPDVQVVILSVQSDVNYMRRAMLAGVVDYVTKPPMADELIYSIRRAAGYARYERTKQHYEKSAQYAQRGKHRSQQTSARVKTPKELGVLTAMEAKQLELSTFDCLSRLQLYQANYLKGHLADRFESLLTGIAHDLKSPISIASSILEILIQEDKTYASSLHEIEQQLLFIKWIADNFMGIALSEKPGSGQVVISNVVKNAIKVIAHKIPRKVRIENQLLPTLTIVSDERILSLVVINLLMNSVENMKDNGGTVVVLGSRTNESICITVADSGEQIPAKFIPELFSFGFTTKEEHLGAGLYVSRRLLYQIRAELRFKSDGVVGGKGFEIKLQKEQKEPVSTPEQNYELIVGLENLKRHLTSYRDKHLSQEDETRLEAEFQKLIAIFTHRLTKELLSAEKMIQDLVKLQKKKNSSFTDSLLKIEKNCTYCRLLSRNILEIGGGISLALSTVSLIDVVKEVLSLIDRKMPKDLYTVEFEVDPKVEDVNADPLQLMQVFMNLIRNALDAMPHGGRLGIDVGQFGDAVFASISDTGIGISSEHLSKLFTMGFSTKAHGYGIGLYSANNIIEKHGGRIEVTSKEGKGTVFTVFLPIR